MRHFVCKHQIPTDNRSSHQPPRDGTFQPDSCPTFHVIGESLSETTSLVLCISHFPLQWQLHHPRSLRHRRHIQTKLYLELAIYEQSRLSPNTPWHKRPSQFLEFPFHKRGIEVLSF